MALLLDPEYPEQLDRVSKIFRSSNPVALPTETVYGLAAPLLDERAVAKVFALKGRPKFHPLIVHVLNWEMAKPLIAVQDDLALRLVKYFWPGPLSILFKKSELVSDLVTGGSDSVVLRCPEHSVFRNVLSRWDAPLVAPSANRFTGISPTDCLSVLKELGAFGLEAVVDGGESARGLESTIVRVDSEKKISVLRPGAVSIEQLKEKLPEGVKVFKEASKEVPGSHARHYSPAKRMLLLSNEKDFKALSKSDLSEMALIRVLAKDAKWLSGDSFRAEFVLSERNSDLEAASALFRILRKLDESRVYKSIAVCETSDQGLGAAINDRLRRAANQS
ncbi:threonylcarbamoyl-AMP synthase [bacterium]|nr:threonylcarbamoyl-AMP synthase [bacterium]